MPCETGEAQLNTAVDARKERQKVNVCAVPYPSMPFMSVVLVDEFVNQELGVFAILESAGGEELSSS